MDIKSLPLNELTEYIVDKGFPAFRAKQLYTWLHKKLIRDAEEMTNIPKDMRKMLSEDIVTLTLAKKLESAIDGTKKYVFMLSDGNVIESVFMSYKHGYSVCISSQAGCRMGCRFCASTLLGLSRNLTVSEMLDQIYYIERDTGMRISNVVVMGTGEPLDNYDNLCTFIKMLSDENGLNISQRNITVSSCGLVPEIRRLADEHFTITFALSLHAATDEKRRELMPIAKRYSLSEVLDACMYYFNETGRRITFEYSLVAGENDSVSDAKELIKLLKNYPCHVNLIPVNPIKERQYKRSDKNSVRRFKELLETNGINATVRRSMGKDIDAACGQLRKAHIDSSKGGTKDSTKGGSSDGSKDDSLDSSSDGSKDDSLDSSSDRLKHSTKDGSKDSLK